MLKIILAVLMLCYPVLVYVGLGHFDVRFMAAGLLVVLLIRAWIMPREHRYRIWGMVVIGAVVFGLVSLFNDPFYLRLYPVMMSLMGLAIFGYSLYRPPSIIETFARLYEFKNGDMPDHVKLYTRNVTKFWCLFFIINAAIASYSLFASLAFWTLYNGLISYILMGCLFAGEFAYRMLVVKRREGHGHD